MAGVGCVSLLFDQNLSRRLPAMLADVWLRIGNGLTRDVHALLRSRAVVVRAFLSDPAASVLELP
jgi:predicted nuclease of predicted toxin-antitoxin system